MTFERNELNCEVSCYIAGNFEPEKFPNLTVTAVVGQYSWVTVHC